MHEIYHSIMKDNPKAFARDTEDFLGVVLDQKDTVYFGSALNAVGYSSIVPLDIPEKISTSNGWSFKKGSELRPLFNYHLLKMRESGILSNIFHVRDTQTPTV